VRQAELAGRESAKGGTMNPSRLCTPGMVVMLVVRGVFAGVPPTIALAQWTVTNLHPAGAISSRANGGIGNQQVGYAQIGPTVGHTRAALWTGTAASFVNLHPAGTVYSIANAAGSGLQVGDVYTDGFPRASVWSDTAASWVNLHPVGSINSNAFGASGGFQVGRTNVGYYRAALWSGSAASWVDLNPPPTNGYTHSSEAFAVSGGKQVGYFVAVGGVTSATLWSGNAASLVNLHPAGSGSQSWAYGLDGTQQVGVVRVPDTTSHAALWQGSAASWVDLHPAGATNSRASSVASGTQAGYADVGGKRRASLWTGSAATWFDLSVFLPAGFTTSVASAIWIDAGVTYVAGYGFNSTTQRDEALLWINHPPCKGDLNGDGLVDDTDFSPFAVAYNILDCTDPAMPAGCPADLNGDGFVDDNDFIIFVAAYNALVCP